jgi:membrane protease YdiL (CAAX protease family)
MGENYLALFSIVSIVVLFFFYHFIAVKKILPGLLKRYIYTGHSNESIDFAGEKAAGIFFTGVIPFVIFVMILDLEPEMIGMSAGRFQYFWYLYLLLPAATVIISFVTSKSSGIQAGAPQLRLKKWNLRHLILTVSLWLVYIFGYEFFFRGILWFLCYNAFGFWLALGINTLLYSAVHLPQGMFMSTGAIPLGILFCLLSYITGSFYLAFLIHACMAISIEISSAYHNPLIHFWFSNSNR